MVNLFVIIWAWYKDTGFAFMIKLPEPNRSVTALKQADTMPAAPACKTTGNETICTAVEAE